MTHKLPPKTDADEEHYKTAAQYPDVIEHIYDAFKDTGQHDRKMDREYARKLTSKENLEPKHSGLTIPTNREGLEGVRSWAQRTQSTNGDYKEDPIFAEWPSNEYVDALNTIHTILCEQTDAAVTIEGEWYDSEFGPGFDYRTKFTVSDPDSYGTILTTLAIELNTNGVLRVNISTRNSAAVTTVEEFKLKHWADMDKSVLKDRLWCRVIAGAYADEILKGTVLTNQESMALVLDRAGYSDEEIGRLVGVHQSTVGTYLQRARQKREDAAVEIDRRKKTIDVVDNLSASDLEESSTRL